MQTQTRRPGFYVEGRFFSDRYAQAEARASFLASEYGRPIEVVRRDFDGNTKTVRTVIRRQHNA